MTTAKQKPSKTKRARAKARPTYRGIRLQPVFARSRFSAKQIREAVEAAIAETPDAFARKT